MSPNQYKRYQKFISAIFDQIDSACDVSTVFGNEVFQRVSEASFEVYKKYDLNDTEPDGDESTEYRSHMQTTLRAIYAFRTMTDRQKQKIIKRYSLLMLPLHPKVERLKQRRIRERQGV